MNKRLLKRHKRQVARAKEHVKLSEPDVRTPEQIRAAREASRPDAARRDGPLTHYPKPPIRDQAVAPAESEPKADA